MAKRKTRSKNKTLPTHGICKEAHNAARHCLFCRDASLGTGPCASCARRAACIVHLSRSRALLAAFACTILHIRGKISDFPSFNMSIKLLKEWCSVEHRSQRTDDCSSAVDRRLGRLVSRKQTATRVIFVPHSDPCHVPRVLPHKTYGVQRPNAANRMATP